MLQVVNKIQTRGGVEEIAKLLHEKLGGKIIAFEPTKMTNPNIIQPQYAIDIKGQYFPIGLKFWYDILRLIFREEKVLLHQPTLASTLLMFIMSTFRKNFVLFKHARGDGILGYIIDFLTKIIIKMTRKPCIVTSRHEMKFSKLSKYCKVVNFPILGGINKEIQPRLHPKALNLVIIARLVKYKGILPFLKEFQMIKDLGCPIFLDIIGDGPLRARIEKEANQLNNVRVHGALCEQDKIDILNKADALVVCSVSKGEAFNLTQLEALKLRKPVILKRLPSGTQDTAWNANTVLRYRDGKFSDVLDSLLNLTLSDFDHDLEMFNKKYSEDEFFFAIENCFE